ncbi:LysR family transcriptional regulator [Vibrio astriarenae]
MKTIEQQLSRLDLNLLVSLSVLLKEQNVTRAAQVLYLSQPAMSRTLGRLRALFDDPLFYRESSGLVPTQKALELQAPLEELLRAMQHLISRTSFDPATTEHAFAISLPPLMSQFMLAPLAKAFVSEAPNGSLVEFPAQRDPMKQLADRDVDFTIHIEKPSVSSDFLCKKITSTYPLFYVAPNHPLASKKKVSLKNCLTYPFVDFSLNIQSHTVLENPIDNYLNEEGLARNVVFKSGHLLTLVDVMQSSDTILVSSHKLATVEEINQKLVPVLALNNDKRLRFDIYLIEHKRTMESAPHQWLKQLILNTLTTKKGD